MDSLAVLNPNDPSPGYCIYTGIAGEITNRVFELFYDGTLKARMVVSDSGGYRYDEETDSIVTTGSLPPAGTTQEIITGTGLTEVSVSARLVTNNFTKSLIIYKALPAEEP